MLGFIWGLFCREDLEDLFVIIKGFIEKNILNYCFFFFMLGNMDGKRGSFRVKSFGGLWNDVFLM